MYISQRSPIPDLQHDTCAANGACVNKLRVTAGIPCAGQMMVEKAYLRLRIFEDALSTFVPLSKQQHYSYQALIMRVLWRASPAWFLVLV